MIGIPHIALLGLIETVIVLLVAVVLLGIKLRKNSKSVSKPEEEKEGTDEEVETLKERIRGLESELEEARAVSPEPKAEDTIAEIKALKDEIRGLESELEKAYAVEKSSPDKKPSEPSVVEKSGETEEISEAEKQVSAQEFEQDKDDNVSATPQDVVLMNSLQIKILREQKVELASVLDTLEMLEQGSGAQETAKELSRLKEVDNKISELIISFEKENSSLKQLVENWDMDSHQAEKDDELAASRVRIAELQEELSKTKEEITSLEHEYDVLFKKTNG